MEKVNWREQLYPIVVSMLPVLGIALYLNEIQGWELNSIFLMIGIVFLIIIIHIFYLVRKQPVFYLALSISILMIVIVFISKREQILSTGKDTMLLVRGGIIVLAAIASYICAEFLIMKEIIAAILLVFLVLAGGYQLEGMRIAIASVVTYCILALSEYCITWSLRKRKMENKKILSAMLPIYMVLFVLIAISPAQTECLKWRMLRSTVSTIKTTAFNVYDHFKGKGKNGYGDYAVAMTGYSESGTIGEGIVDGGGAALTVETEESQSRSIYLVGNYKNELEGSQWIDTRSKETYPVEVSDQRLDTLELLYALQRYNSFQDYRTYLSLNKLKITYTGIRTKTLFGLAKTDSILFDDDTPEREESTLESRFIKLAGDGTSYVVNYYALNYGGNKFSSFIKKAEGYCYQPDREINVKIKNGQYITLDRHLEKQLSDRKKYIYSNYLDVGDDIPARVGTLAKNITKHCTTKYDQLIALEKYLHTYSYTMNPPKCPSEREIIDYFLFDSKEGYCTYFASAMAVMARTLGIPTRYVQGYLIGSTTKKWTSRQVLDREAHAWIEAYIDGVGWIAFEPTAGYTSEQYSPWTVDNNGNVQNHVMDKDMNKTEKAHKGNEFSKAASYMKRGSFIFVILLLCMAAVIVARILMNKHIYKRASDRQKVYYEVARMSEMLKIFGIERKSTDTWKGFMDNMQRSLPVEKAMEGSVIFSRMRYRGDEPKKEEVAVFNDINKQLLDMAKERCGKWKYYRMLIHFKLQPIRFRQGE